MIANYDNLYRKIANADTDCVFVPIPRPHNQTPHINEYANGQEFCVAALTAYLYQHSPGWLFDGLMKYFRSDKIYDDAPEIPELIPKIDTRIDKARRKLIQAERELVALLKERDNA